MCLLRPHCAASAAVEDSHLSGGEEARPQPRREEKAALGSRVHHAPGVCSVDLHKPDCSMTQATRQP